MSIAKLKQNNLTKPCGTYLRYQSGCRCEPCHAAWKEYRVQCAAKRKAGETNGIVSAAAARAHLLFLQTEHKIPCDAIALATGLPRQRIILIRKGTQLNLREHTERLILKVEPSIAPLGGLMAAAKTIERIKALAAVGIGQRELGRLLGKRSQLQIRGECVTSENARRIRLLYDKHVRMPDEAKRRAHKNYNPAFIKMERS